MPRTIRSIKPQTLGKMLGVSLGALSFLMAIPLLCVGLIGLLTAPTGGNRGAAVPFIFMIIGGLVAPLVYTLIGYLQGLIVASVYNFVAGRFGGIQVEVE